MFIKAKTVLAAALGVLTLAVLLAGGMNNAQVKWVDFTPTARALEAAYEIDVKSEGAVSWIDLLAYASAKTGGVYDKRAEDLIEEGKEAVQSGAARELKYFAYYQKAYTAVLGGMVGHYEAAENGQHVTRYGLKAFSPIAAGYYYNHYDDFGASRTYGFRREHLGHDLMGSVGTPVCAVESGVVEAVGWNQYGGWRVGIRSLDGQRYYYYAHLRKDTPYNDLYEGKLVTAGEVIGFLGMTGYSAKENVNNISTPHLHFGMQLLLEDAPDTYEIWIDLYELTKFLARHTSQVRQQDGVFYPVLPIIDPLLPD